MTRPKVWDLWKKTKHFFNDYTSTLINLVLIFFIICSLISMTHPHMLHKNILWFIDDIYYCYLWQASIWIGSNLSWFILLLPDIPSDIPTKENKEFFFHFIVYVIPGLWDLLNLYFIISCFTLDIYELIRNPRDLYLQRRFIRAWVKPCLKKWRQYRKKWQQKRREVRYFLSGLGPKVRDNPNELIRWILLFAVPNQDPVVTRPFPRLPWFKKDWVIRKVLWKSTRLTKQHYRYLGSHFSGVYFAWNLNPLFRNNHHLASRFFIFCNTQESFKGEKWFNFSYDKDRRIRIFHNKYTPNNILVGSDYLKKVEADENWKTLSPEPSPLGEVKWWFFPKPTKGRYVTGQITEFKEFPYQIFMIYIGALVLRWQFREFFQ